MIARQQTNAAGLEIITSSERFYSKPYLCPARIWTNGYGHTKGVTPTTPPVTHEQALINLRADMADAERAVARLVNVPLTSNQYSALVSLVFNIGSGRFQSSTLRMRLNRGDYAAAAAQFKVWRMGGGKVLAGLVTRRRREEALFNTPDQRRAPSAASNSNRIAQAINDATRAMAGKLS